MYAGRRRDDDLVARLEAGHHFEAIAVGARAIWMQDGVIDETAAMAIAQVVMVMLMVITSLHMSQHHHALSSIAAVMSSHAIQAPILMSVAQMPHAAKEGAFIEFCVPSLVAAKPSSNAAAFVAAIRQVGPESVILSSDLGQPENPLPPDGLATGLAALRAQGLTEQELDRMSKINPARLLGLTVP